MSIYKYTNLFLLILGMLDLETWESEEKKFLIDILEKTLRSEKIKELFYPVLIFVELASRSVLARMNVSGVNIFPNYDIFASPLFSKMIFLRYSENFLFFPHFSTSFPVYSRFFLTNHHIFPQPANNSYFCPWGEGQNEKYIPLGPWSVFRLKQMSSFTTGPKGTQGFPSFFTNHHNQF